MHCIYFQDTRVRITDILIQHFWRLKKCDFSQVVVEVLGGGVEVLEVGVEVLEGGGVEVLEVVEVVEVSVGVVEVV